jgi:membrane-bound metal-dependent hydrolase YbcI (DUF457 family)
MGRSHAVSGGSVWLAGCAALTAAGVAIDPATIAVGGLVAAGSALLPDMDHPGATVAHALGPATRLAARGVSWLGDWLRDHTCGCCTTSTTGGHRTITHTAVGAVVAGLTVALLGGLAGRRAAVVVVFVAAALAVRGMLRRRVRGRWMPPVVGLAAAVAAWASTGPDGSWWWIGAPVAAGCLTHTMGDWLTLSGVPLCWPLRIAGCRWHRCGSPRPLRFRTGGAVERWAVVPLLLAVGAGSVWTLAV